MNIRKYMFQYYIIRALEILALCIAWGAFVCQTCLVSEGFLHWSVLAITGILTFFLTMYVPYKNIWLAFWHQEDELDKVVDKIFDAIAEEDEEDEVCPCCCKKNFKCPLKERKND